MADIQLDHGHVQIANRLFEAMTVAPLNATQLKILHVLVRLTYGWKRRRTVRLSNPEIAALCGASASGGGFRHSLHELVLHNVVWELEPAVGRRPALYALNKDFETWVAPFWVSQSRVAALYDREPEHDESKHPTRKGSCAAKVAETGHATDGAQADESKGNAVRSLPESGHTIERRRQAESGHDSRLAESGQVAESGQASCPNPATQTTAKSFNGETYERLKKERKKDSSSELGTAPPAVAPVLAAAALSETAAAADANPDLEANGAYARALTTAINRAVTAKFGEQTRSVLWGSAVQLASDLRAQAVPLALAQATAEARVATMLKPPSTAEYFRLAILEAHAQAAQRASDQAAAAKAAPLASGTWDAEAFNADREAHAAYDAEARATAEAWLAEHPNEAQRLTTAAEAEFESLPETGFVRRAREARLTQLVAARIGFPEFEAWRAARASPEPVGVTLAP